MENILLPKIVSTIYSGTVLIEKKSFEERAGRKAMIVKGEIAEAYYQGMVYNEVIALIKNQMELEYFSRSILDPVLNRFICSEIKQAYYCEIIVKDLSSLLIKS